MFSLINSTILIALGATVLPVLIHLLNRQKRQRIKYSSIRFLKFLEKQRIRKLSIYQYLLIIIRTLIILFLVMAFIRPVYNNTSQPLGTRTSVTAVVILDNGLNMRGFDAGINKFDQALDRLDMLLATFSEQDKVFILTAADLHIITLDSLRKNLLACTYTTAKFDESWKLAKKEILKHPNLVNEIHIISDFSSLSKAFYDRCQTDSSITFYFHKIGSQYTNNVSVDSVLISNQIIEQDKNVTVTVYLSNRGSIPLNDFSVNLYSHGRRLAYQNISLGEMENKSITLKFRPTDSGFFDGYIEVPEDDLIEDNRYYFSFYVLFVIYLSYSLCIFQLNLLY